MMRRLRIIFTYYAYELHIVLRILDTNTLVRDCALLSFQGFLTPFPLESLMIGDDQSLKKASF